MKFKERSLIRTIKRNATSCVKVRVIEGDSTTLVDIRLCIDSGSYTGPTAKGISLRPEEVHEVLLALKQAEYEIKGLSAASGGSQRGWR